MVNTLATDALVLQNRAISIHNTHWIHVFPNLSRETIAFNLKAFRAQIPFEDNNIHSFKG